MKANRRFVNGDDDAVSPVIAVILMVAITVVLAATVYLWVSGFGTNQATVVSASFAAKAVDLPTAANSGADADTSDDVIEVTYTSGTADYVDDDISIQIGGTLLAGGATIANKWGPCTAGNHCSTLPGGNADWARGESIFLWKGQATTVEDLKGTHLLKVIVKGQVVLDTVIEVHDNGAN